MPYKKTVKKYNNKKSNKGNNSNQNKKSLSDKKENNLNNTSDILKTDKNTYSTGNKQSSKIEKNAKQQKTQEKITSNSTKPENKVIKQSHSIPPKNSNLKEKQDQDIVAYRKNKRRDILYSIIVGLITIVAVYLIGKNIFNTSFIGINPKVMTISKTMSIITFFIFYISLILGICLIVFSNKTDNHAYLIDIILYTIMLVLCFTISLLLYSYNIFLAVAILAIIATILSIYLCYRYFVSYLASGIMQVIATLPLLYLCYLSLAFTL